MDFFRLLWGALPTAGPRKNPGASAEEVQLPSGPLAVTFIRHPRARRYRLIFRRDGDVRCTLPARGSMAEARRFVAANRDWLERQIHRRQQSPPAFGWKLGDNTLFDGQLTPITLVPASEGAPDQIQVGVVAFAPPDPPVADLRPVIEAALRRYAQQTLPGRTAALAEAHSVADRIRRVTIRNQRSRWGSCSRRGVISLNWRLVQAPPSVRDYIIVHELAHLVHLNHSARFWALVAEWSPDYKTAEEWLRRSGRNVL